MGDGGQLDLFTVTAIDPPWRDNRDAMEYPFLALQKRRTTPIRYERRRRLAQRKRADGHLDRHHLGLGRDDLRRLAHQRGDREPPQDLARINFVPHDCLKQIGRGTGGDQLPSSWPMRSAGCMRPR